MRWVGRQITTCEVPARDYSLPLTLSPSLPLSPAATSLSLAHKYAITTHLIYLLSYPCKYFANYVRDGSTCI